MLALPSHNALHGQVWYMASCEVDTEPGLRQNIATVAVSQCWRDQRTGRLDAKLIDRIEERFLLGGWAEKWVGEKQELITKVFYKEDEDEIVAFLRAGGLGLDGWETSGEAQAREARRKADEEQRKEKVKA